MVDLKTLDTRSLILDITTNLSRIGNLALAGNNEKVKYFGKETKKYIDELEKRDYPETFHFWIKKTKDITKIAETGKYKKEYLADDSFTCGVVLQNRATNLM